MCNCTQTEGFQQSLSKAKSLTDKTGETHVVYVHKAVGRSFVRKESELNDELNICCYFLPNGKEVVYTPKEVAKTANVDSSKISVDSSTDILPAKKAIKKAK